MNVNERFEDLDWIQLAQSSANTLVNL